MITQNITYDKIKVMSNKQRFKILLLTQNEEVSIPEISKKLKLSYHKTTYYITMLEKQGLIKKIRKGKGIAIKSKVKITSQGIKF